MRRAQTPLVRASLAAVLLCLAACGGGGGGSNTLSTGDTVTPQEGDNLNGQMLSFEDHVEPIMQAKCTGCHNSGDNPLAPFSLEGAELANSFKSAINFAIESGAMPPAGTQQLTASDQAKILAWSSNEPYNFVPEILHISLIEAKAWDVQSKVSDTFPEHRPKEVTCARDSGWMVEEGALEIRTEFCDYLSLSQHALLDLDVGTEMELALSYSDLNFNAPASAHIAVSIGGNILWESEIAIPSERALLKEIITLPFAVARGDSIEIHLHNHGDNAWTIHSLEALVSNDQELAFCPTFDSTFEAIQATVFEQAGCANSLCHGEAAEGGLDLTPSRAFDNLVGVSAQGSSLLLVDPRNPSTSYLYHKLSAKTFPDSYAIDGSPMPSSGSAISAGQLEAIRLWIEAGAPDEGSVGDTLGRGEDEIERLLGVCLPEAEAVNTTPLPPPEPERGIQFKMPPHEVPAEKEREICFAVYEDFRDQIPAQYLTEDRNHFYVKSGDAREDAFTHHNLIYHAPVSVEQIHDPSFGEWTCAGGDNEGQSCEPTDRQSCGEQGQCRSEIRDSVACRGYGPTSKSSSGSILGLGSGPNREGFYAEYPSHGIFYWNSHAFNLTTEDGVHHVWRNLHFADDRRFRANSINVTQYIISGTGTPPFGKKTVCKDYIFNQGDGLLGLSSHTHKRGERFFMNVNGEQVYETFTYDEPLQKRFEPAMVFNSSDPAQRTLEWCATWNNGVNADGSPNIETVTRLSRRPSNARQCNPTACVAGNIGAPCNGADDDAACDSSPGAGDGWCDACIIMPGVSSDDEMFILLGSKLVDHDAKMHTHAPGSPAVAITNPANGDTFTAGDVITLDFNFMHFDLMPPQGHNHDDMSDHNNTGDNHGDPAGGHGSVTSGHYHVYLDTDDDSADHVTAWSELLDFELPADLAPGEHVIRISLRAPDHHAVGAEERVTIVVQ